MLLDIIEAYTQPHRHYHTLEHIAAMLMDARRLGKELSETMIYAILYHDFVYNIPAPMQQNEADSALELQKRTKDILTLEERERGRDLILATGAVLAPGVPELDDEQWLICGLDLFRWADAEHAFITVEQLKKENKHLSEERWVKGRSVFLLNMLAKDYIIHGSFFDSVGEMAAWHANICENIEDEIDFLKRDAEAMHIDWQEIVDAAAKSD